MDIKKVSFDIWVQLLGMLGVLGGLIFVGLEMQQTQRIALAGQAQSRTEMVAAEMLAPLEGNIDYLRARYESWEEIPKDLAPLKIQMFRWRWIMMENNWLQNELGLLPEITWAQAEGRIQSHWNDCETRSHISEEAIRNLTLEFKRYLETLPDPCV